MPRSIEKSFKEYLLSLNIPPNGRYRGDCYVCGGNNSLSVNDDGGVIVYHCFRASCDCRGSIGVGLGIDYITSLFSCTPEASATPERPFEVPEHFVEVQGRPEIIEYLFNNNCLDAYNDKRADIKYDPKQNRVVFMCKGKDGEYVGATGRALERGVVPKWYIYGNGGCSFFVDCNRACDDNAILRDTRKHSILLVEDCASACAVSCCMDAIALLGTNMANVDLGVLANYATVIVALDKDASVKALKLQRNLSFLVDDARVVLLERDLKYLKKEEIKKVFHEYYQQP